MSRHHRAAKWSTGARRARPIIAATLPAPCIDRCGRLVYPDQAWDVGHIVPLSVGGTADLTNLGPSHSTCNRKAGGRMGAAITHGNRTERRLPAW